MERKELLLLVKDHLGEGTPIMVALVLKVWALAQSTFDEEAQYMGLLKQDLHPDHVLNAMHLLLGGQRSQTHCCHQERHCLITESNHLYLDRLL
jgi:hypothetical protein